MMIYLDNAATSFPKPEPVYQALDHFARTSLANPGRAGHRMAIAAERTLDETRHRLNQLFGGEVPERWILTLNCTDGLNLAIKGLLRQGDHVVTTDLEHNSVSRPLRALEKANVITLTRGLLGGGIRRSAGHPRCTLGEDGSRRHDAHVERAGNGAADRDQLPRSFGPRVPSSSLMRPSRPEWCRSTSETPIDLLAFPGHKAPLRSTGTGALYVGPRTDGRLRPWREGGTGGDSSKRDPAAALPYLLEGGNAQRSGHGRFVRGGRLGDGTGPDRLRAHEVGLLQHVVDWTEQTPGWKIAGRWDPATHAGGAVVARSRRTHTPGPGLDSRCQLRDRSAARSPTGPAHPPSHREPPGWGPSG